MTKITVRTFVVVFAAIPMLIVSGARLAAEEAANQKNAVVDIAAAAGSLDPAAKGKELYHRMPCVRCHGGDCVQNSSAAFDLRTFPHDDKARFVNSVTKGKNNRMPPWGDVLTTEEIDQLWAYVQSVGKP
jgi:mono/diheme cytochrome c family protein